MDILRTIPCFSPDLTFDCGQAFRWTRSEDGTWTAPVSGAIRKVRQVDENRFVFPGCSDEDFQKFWVSYLNLQLDYPSICESLCNDPTLCKAVRKYYGIRVLTQPFWETLATFIISSNNNIPRIRGIVDRLCQTLGEPLAEGLFSFPSPERLAGCSAEDLVPLRAGYRVGFLLDAAEKVASGKVSGKRCKELPLQEAEAELRSIRGVGKKVAQCVLLYSCGHMNAFPVDTWVTKVMAEHYPNGLPECAKGVEGIAQQYLFHWIRMIT